MMSTTVRAAVCVRLFVCLCEQWCKAKGTRSPEVIYLVSQADLCLFSQEAERSAG